MRGLKTEVRKKRPIDRGSSKQECESLQSVGSILLPLTDPGIEPLAENQAALETKLTDTRGQCESARPGTDEMH